MIPTARRPIRHAGEGYLDTGERAHITHNVSAAAATNVVSVLYRRVLRSHRRTRPRELHSLGRIVPGAARTFPVRYQACRTFPVLAASTWFSHYWSSCDEAGPENAPSAFALSNRA
jgi:hypothetical protein